MFQKNLWVIYISFSSLASSYLQNIARASHASNPHEKYLNIPSQPWMCEDPSTNNVQEYHQSLGHHHGLKKELTNIVVNQGTSISPLLKM